MRPKGRPAASSPLDRAAAQRVVVEPPPAHAAYRGQQLIVVGLTGDRIDGGGVDDQQWSGGELVKEARIRLVEPFEVLAVDMLLVIDAAAGDALEQYVYRCLQVHDQVGRRRTNVELDVELLVEGELVVIQRDAREQAILLQQVVRDSDRVEQVCLLQRLKLLGALQQKVQLRRQGCGTRIAVEALEEGVVLGLLEDRLRAEALAETPDEAGLTDADRPFHHDELVERNTCHVTRAA